MYVVYAFSYQIVLAVMPIVTVIMPKYIIGELLGQRRVGILILSIGIVLGINFFGSLFSAFLSGRMFTSKGVVFNKFQCFMTERLSECDYEQLEDSDFLDIKEKAHKFLYANGQGFGIVLDSAINILGKMFIFISLIVILSTLSIYIVFVFTLLILLSSFVDSYVRDKYTKWDIEKAPIERKTSYLINLIEDFSYGKETRMYNLKRFLLDKISNHLNQSNEFYKKQTRTLNISKYFSALTSLVRDGVAYIYLIFKILADSIGIGDFTMYLGAVSQFSNAMSDFMRSVLDIKQFGGYYDALNAYIDAPSKMREGKRLHLPNSTQYMIEFDNVSFKYKGQSDYALKNITLAIRPGEKISIVGENGAGKTTLAKLLIRLYDPLEGRITLNGIDIRDIDYDEYQSILSAVFQDYKLFSFTLKENVAFGGFKQDDDVIDTLIKSGLKTKFEHLDKGIYTNIYKNFEPDGFEPSGGEGQKIALARALYKDAPIVILDEPTAALDPRAEYEIYQHFNTLIDGKTAVYISHRLSSARFCDVVAVMQQGKIVEFGSHDALIENGGLYSELFNMQAQFYTARRI
jgi:ABC-type multidrug transport system fused ATPase/permease subunit